MSGSRFSSSMPRQDPTRGIGERDRDHTHRKHSNEQQQNWGDNTSDVKHSPVDKLTSPNRFERLSLSNETTVSNRFEGLDPDSEGPGETTSDSVTEKERKSRGQLSKRNRSPSRKGSTKDDGGTERRDSRDSEGSDGIGKKESELSREIDVSNCLTEEEGGGESTFPEEKTAETLSPHDTSEEGEKVEKTSTSRVRYPRDELLLLKNVPLSTQRPVGLANEYIR